MMNLWNVLNALGIISKEEKIRERIESIMSEGTFYTLKKITDLWKKGERVEDFDYSSKKVEFENVAYLITEGYVTYTKEMCGEFLTPTAKGVEAYKKVYGENSARGTGNFWNVEIGNRL